MFNLIYRTVRHLKLYEKYNQPEIQEGDYIIINILSKIKPVGAASILSRMEYENFINNNIGQVIYIVPYNTDSFYIRYDNIPLNLVNYFHGKIKLLSTDPDLENSRCFNKNDIDIIDFSKDKSELEYIFNSKKYNL